MTKGRYFVTGDTHGDLTKIIDFIQRFELKLGDNIIVLGDFGIFWRKDEKDAKYWMQFYEENCNGVHLYWIDGNHENFDIIKNWNINKNYEYDNSDHIHYCPRGFETNIELQNGEIRKALFIGGADSVDKFRRINHLSWWEDETITNKDIENIKGSYYYVFSHCCPRSVFENNKVFLCNICNINENNVVHQSEDKLEQLKNNIYFKEWWFGHYHVNKYLGNNFYCLLDDFVELK